MNDAHDKTALFSYRAWERGWFRSQGYPAAGVWSAAG